MSCRSVAQQRTICGLLTVFLCDFRMQARDTGQHRRVEWLGLHQTPLLGARALATGQRHSVHGDGAERRALLWRPQHARRCGFGTAGHGGVDLPWSGLKNCSEILFECRSGFCASFLLVLLQDSSPSAHQAFEARRRTQAAHLQSVHASVGRTKTIRKPVFVSFPKQQRWSLASQTGRRGFGSQSSAPR